MKIRVVGWKILDVGWKIPVAGRKILDVGRKIRVAGRKILDVGRKIPVVDYGFIRMLPGVPIFIERLKGLS